MDKEFLLDDTIGMMYKFEQFCLTNDEYKQIRNKLNQLENKTRLICDVLGVLKISCIRNDFYKQADKLNETQKLLAHDVREIYLKYDAEILNLNIKLANIRERLSPEFVKLVMSNF